MENPFPILIVEDNSADRYFVKSALIEAGYKVVIAKNGKEALERLKKTFISMLITDWLMPEMDGLELTQAIRRHNFPAYIYIILLTGNRFRKVDVVAGLNAGVDDYLLKPPNLCELLARIRVGRRILGLERNLSNALEGSNQTLARMKLINQVMQKINEGPELKDILKILLKESSILIGATTASLLFLEGNNQKLRVREAWGKDRDKILGLSNDVEENRISCEVVRTKVPILIEDINLKPEYKTRVYKQKRLESQSIISVPLLVKEKIIGVMNFGMIFGMK